MKITLIFMLILSSCKSSIKKNPPLETVKNVDLNRYLGKWHEIARFDQIFQKGCTMSEAIYSKRKDGDIKVLNRCRIKTASGEIKEAIGRAWVVDKKSNAKLKVQFFLKELKVPFLSGDYWILHLGENYQNVIIGDPSRRYLWILSRDKIMNDDLYKEMVNKAKDMHFDISKLIKTQNGENYE